MKKQNEVGGNKMNEKEIKKEVVSDEQIAKWKKEFGKVYKTTVSGEDYVWRTLRRKEYIEIMGQDLDLDISEKLYMRQEKMAKKVLLYPTNIEEQIEQSAGLATTLSDEIILKSGFDSNKSEEL